MRPGDAAAVIHSHSALPLRSRFLEPPERRLAPRKVCPGSTRHDGCLSRTFSCAASSVGTRHGGRRQYSESLWCSSPISRLLHRGASEQSTLLPVLARGLSHGRPIGATAQRLSLFLSLRIGCCCHWHGRARFAAASVTACLC